MAFAPDINKARRIAKAVNDIGAPGLEHVELGDRVAQVLSEESPDLQTLAAACAMVRPTTQNPNWHEQMRFALTAPLQVAMVESQVAAQAALSNAADNLARRNFFVAGASLIASALTLLVTAAMAFHWL